jgi:hypothetical protein
LPFVLSSSSTPHSCSCCSCRNSIDGSPWNKALGGGRSCGSIREPLPPSRKPDRSLRAGTGEREEEEEEEEREKEEEEEEEGEEEEGRTEPGASPFSLLSLARACEAA